jgi:hypothetical protein
VAADSWQQKISPRRSRLSRCGLQGLIGQCGSEDFFVSLVELGSSVAGIVHVDCSTSFAAAPAAGQQHQIEQFGVERRPTRLVESLSVDDPHARWRSVEWAAKHILGYREEQIGMQMNIGGSGKEGDAPAVNVRFILPGQVPGGDLEAPRDITPKRIEPAPKRDYAPAVEPPVVDVMPNKPTSVPITGRRGRGFNCGDARARSPIKSGWQMSLCSLLSSRPPLAGGVVAIGHGEGSVARSPTRAAGREGRSAPPP